MNSQENKWAAIVARSLSDEVFRKRLLSDLAAVLEAEGMEVPAGVTLKVVEDTGAVRHLVLPAAKRLDDESLDAVTGGLFADCQGSDTPADWCRIYGNG